MPGRFVLQKGTAPFNFATFVAAYTDNKYGMFLHFNSQTWSGNGVVGPYCSPIYDINNFNPPRLNVDQWISTMVVAKMKYAVLVVVQAPGCCLWNTATTNYNVFHTTWYSGAGIDIVTQFANKCRAADILPCFYISTCQRRFEYEHPGFTQADYLAYLKAQITELLTNYGQIGAIWVDNNNWNTTGSTPEWPVGFSPINPLGTNIYYPFSAAGDLKAFVQSIQKQCIVVYDDHAFTFAATDIKEAEYGSIVDSSPLIAAGGNAGYEACATIFTGGKFFADQNYTLAASADLISVTNSTVTRGGSFLLNAPPNQTGLIDSSIVNLLTTVAAGLNF